MDEFFDGSELGWEEVRMAARFPEKFVSEILASLKVPADSSPGAVV